MEYNYIYSIICLVSSILVFSLSLLSIIHYKSTSFSKPFSSLMFFCGIYIFGYAFELMNGDLDWIFLWLRIEYLGISFIAACWLWLTMSFTEKDKYMKWPFFVFIFGISLVLLLSVLTNNAHHLYYSHIKIRDNGYFQVANLGKGVLYMVHSVWLFLSFFISALMYIQYYFKTNAIFKKQALLTSFIALEIIVGFLIDLSGLVPWNLGIDMGPIIIIGNGCIGAYIIFKTGIFSISPIARDKIFESMKEGVIVTDLDGIIADYNPAARDFLPELSKEWIGIKLLDVIPQFKRYSNDYKLLEMKPYILEKNGKAQFFEIRQVPVIASSRKKIGTAWYMRQITEQYKLLEKITNYAERDELTGIWNRRKWLEIAQNELQRSRRHNKIFSIMLIDIDYFKKVNDTMGHEAGDKVLINITDMISKELRSYDAIGRLGGEEFAILFPEADKKTAALIAKRLLKKISNNKIYFENKKITVTVSAGISVYEKDSKVTLEELLRKADKGLYQAKNRGRNQVHCT